MLNKKSGARICLSHCEQGTRAIVEKTPFIIGAGAACDMRIASASCPDLLCTIHEKDGYYQIVFGPDCADALVDGGREEFFTIKEGEEHTMLAGEDSIAFKCTIDINGWRQRAAAMRWHVYDTSHSVLHGPLSVQGVGEWLSGDHAPPFNEVVVIPPGLKHAGFFASDVIRLFPVRPKPPPMPASPNGSAPQSGSPDNAQEPVNSEYGEFTCPVCWFKFDRGDVMSIAVHASLRGDPQLGEDHMQRFHATRFNDRSQALDAMGIPSADLACPHCRRKLPPGFLDVPHHIFSIVGAPSSGKSYYLSVLIKTLQSCLFQNFGINFRDADPSENVILTQMKSQLFSSATPQEALLAKTELEGSLYESLPRLGRKVRLPKPFVFKISHPKLADSDFSVVFYDNAGEHFEPTRNSADSPGAQHIAVASGIFFLFDPLHNAEFRQRLDGVVDPQLAIRRLDQQDVILAETEVRIKSVLGLNSRQQVATPLAVMIGKCDTWLGLLGDEPLFPVVNDHAVALGNISKNSERIRQLLITICPAVVSNAEAISSNVAYFAISPLGVSPVEFTDSEGHVRIGPDPQQIRPMFVEAPTLWVLAQIAPGMVISQPLA